MGGPGVFPLPQTTAPHLPPPACKSRHRKKEPSTEAGTNLILRVPLVHVLGKCCFFSCVTCLLHSLKLHDFEKRKM